MSRGRPDARRRANLLYQPVDLIAHTIGALLARPIFSGVWSIIEHADAAPKPADERQDWREILPAAGGSAYPMGRTGASAMYSKQRVLAVIATLGILAVAGCSTSSTGNSTSGSPAGGSASASTPLASSSAVAKAKQQATACLQKTGTAGLLSSAGRSQLVTCLENIVPPAEREAFKNCMASAGLSDQVWTKAGREKFTSTSLEACLNSAAAATPSASLAGLTVLHLDKDFDLIAEITAQPMERLNMDSAAVTGSDAEQARALSFPDSARCGPVSSTLFLTPRRRTGHAVSAGCRR